MTAPIIRASGLTKRFGSFTAVDDLSFEVAQGSIFAFLGANGSGKSTTIRMLIGLLTPTAGKIEVDGIDVVRAPRRVRDHIGYMGQRVSLYQGLTLRENLEFYAGLYDLEGAALEQRWGALRERFALGDAESEKAADLPAGVRQRAGLALSTLHRPRVLFLDEPTAGVDIENRLRFWELIQEEAASGVTVFVTTHFLEEVDYCDWVSFIDAGRLIADAPPEVIRRRYSSGYQIRLDLAPEERTATAASLEAAGLQSTWTGAGLTLSLPTLTSETLAAVAAAGGRGADGRVHVEQPGMSGVFLQLMSQAGGDGRAPDATPASPTVAASTSEGAPTPPSTRTEPSSGATLAARWRRLRTLMRREVRATLRDAFTVTILIAVPIAALLAFGYTMSIEVTRLPLGVHDASGTSASRRLIAELAATDSFAPRPFATRAALDRAMVSGAVSAAIVIPSDFGRALGGSIGERAPEIQVLYDGGETVVAGNAEASLQGIIRATTPALLPPGGDVPAPQGLSVVTRVLFNPRLDGTPFMVAGTFGFVLTFLTTLITAVSVVNERVSGTFEQLQVTPATSAEIVLGKILPLGGVFVVDVVLMVLVAGFLLGVWPAGNPVFFVGVAGFYVLVSLSLGLIFSATSATAAAAVQKTVLFSIPLIFLGGFLFPIRNMPLLFRWISTLLPATHFIAVSRAIYLRAEGPISLLPELGLLALFGIALMAIAFRTVAARA